MSTLQKIHRGFNKAFKDKGIVVEYVDARLTKDDRYRAVSCPFRPTVLPEKIDDEFLKPAILAIVNQVNTPIGRVLLSSHQDAKHRCKFVNLDIDDQGIWNLYICIVK